MKKRVIPVVFIIIAAVLAVIFINREFLYKPHQESLVSKVVTPQVSGTTGKTNSNTLQVTDEAGITSLIKLSNDETLISVVSMDFNGDGLEDQVNAIKSGASPYITLIVGIYNQQNNTYERKASIATSVTQVNTFSYTGMDLTGEHRISLIYQGFTETGNSVLQAFFLSDTNGKFNLKQIADFVADGTIFIQQIDRYDSYERSQSTGACYPIWVYSTDTTPGSNGNDQLQVRYDWNASEGHYTKAVQIRVAGSKLAAKELARIQDGTVKTFAGFLEGMWYKTADKGNGRRYVSFNFSAKEVIFLYNDTEEVYNWANSTLRRNGIYISATNQEIQNLQRRIDIALLGIDSVSIRIQDDVRMIIGENTLWDGEYKKITNNSSSNMTNSPKRKSLEFISVLEENEKWKIDEENSIIFKDGAYSITDKRSGNYTGADSFGQPFIQFRSSDSNSFLSGFYLVSFSKKDNKENTNEIILEPYKITVDGIFPSEKHSVYLKK